MNRHLSRKFILAMLALAASAALLYLGALESAGYVTLCLGTVGAYIAGNVAQKRLVG